MAIFEVRSTVTHRSLMNRSKDDLARWIMHLLICRDESELARVQRVTDLLEANNDYLQQAREARAALSSLIHAADDARLEGLFDGETITFRLRAWKAEEVGLA